MTPKHGKTPAILYTKTYSTASGALPLPSPSGVAVGRGAGLARPTGVDSQEKEAERTRGRGKRSLIVDVNVPYRPLHIWTTLDSSSWLLAALHARLFFLILFFYRRAHE
jgi:hypothetical protein